MIKLKMRVEMGDGEMGAHLSPALVPTPASCGEGELKIQN